MQLKLKVNKFWSKFQELLPDKKFVKLLALIIIPVSMQSLLEVLINIIDSFFILGVGPAQYAAVSAVSIIFEFFFFAGFSICVAGNIFAAQFNGAKNFVGLRETTRFKIVFIFLISLIFGVLFWSYKTPFLNFLLHIEGESTHTTEVIRYAIEYFDIVIWSFPLACFSFAILNTMNVNNSIRFPLIVCVISFIINCTLDPIFIFNVGGVFPEWMTGVRGAAITTLIARIVEASIYIWFLCYKKPVYRPLLFSAVDWAIWLKALRSAGLLFLSEALFAVYTFVNFSLISRIAAVDGFNALRFSGSIIGIFYAVFRGYNSVVPRFVGRPLGNGDVKLAKDNARKILIIITVVSLIFSIVITFISFAINWIELVSLSDPKVKNWASWFVLISAINYFFCSISYNLNSVIRTGGRVLAPTLIDILNYWLFGFGILFLFWTLDWIGDNKPLDLVSGYGIATITGFVISLILSLFLYLKSKWYIKLTKSENDNADQAMVELIYEDEKLLEKI